MTTLRFSYFSSMNATLSKSSEFPMSSVPKPSIFPHFLEDAVYAILFQFYINIIEINFPPFRRTLPC